jgi:hypothetical protein
MAKKDEIDAAAEKQAAGMSKEDKAEAKQEAAQDKADEAYKTYEKEQADHEKKHPGEIDEAAYKKYETAYNKVPEDADSKPVGLLGDLAPDPMTPPVVVDPTVAATEAHAAPGSTVLRKPKDWEAPVKDGHKAPVVAFNKVDVVPSGDGWMVQVSFANEADAKKFYGACKVHEVVAPPPAPEPLTL